MLKIASVLLLVQFASALPAVAQDRIVRAARLVDPATGTVLANPVITVRGGRIVALGSGTRTPAGAEIIDLGSATLLPGLIDAHTHLAISIRPERDGGEYIALGLHDPDPFRALQGAAHAREMLEAGFTTVRDMGNAGRYVDLDLRRAIRDRLVTGPSLLAAGRIIAPFGGQHYLRDIRDERLLADNAEYLIADTPDEITRAVRANVFHGVDLIKVVVDGQRIRYSERDIRQIVEEASRAGLRVAAHAQTADGARDAVAAGVASIEHGWDLPPEVLAEMRHRGTFLVSTDFTEEVLAGFGWPPDRARRIHEHRVARLRAAYAAGVPIAFGSDVMVPVAGRTRGELALGYVGSFQEAGLPPAAILRAFTSDAARLLGIEQDRGLLREGFAADIVAVDGNPLEDPSALQRTVFVMKGGEVIRRPFSLSPPGR